MKKTWLYPAIASIALLASACANNAAPNYTTPNGATTNQAAPHATSYDGMRARDFDGMFNARNNNGNGVGNVAGTRDGMFPGNGAGINNNNATTNGMRPYTAFPDGNAGINGATGTAGIRGIAGTGAGAGTNTGMNHSIYQKNAWNRAGAGVMATGMPRMGYVQTDRQNMRTASANNVYVDRDALAQAVGNVTSNCPGVQRSTVLVTDEEIFVGLQTQGADARTAKNQARMNAMSVSPRYYKVYVTDNQNDIQEIARVAARSSNLQNARTEDRTGVDTLVKRMGGTTDGEQMRTRQAGANKANNATTKSHMGTTGR